MAEKLGILVPTDKHLDHVIGVARAAKKAGKTLSIFLTHKGVLLTQDPRYQELADIGPDEFALCKVSWEQCGLEGRPVPAGMEAKDMANQSRHVYMIEMCDRYLVL